jgi:hypothetical protein
MHDGLSRLVRLFSVTMHELDHPFAGYDGAQNRDDHVIGRFGRIAGHHLRSAVHLVAIGFAVVTVDGVFPVLLQLLIVAAGVFLF